MADPILEKLQKADMLRRLQEADQQQRAAPPVADGADENLSQADVEAEIPLPSAKVRAGVDKRTQESIAHNPDLTAKEYVATPEGRAAVLEQGMHNRRQFFKGVTFGASPRIEAAANTAFGLAGDYSADLARIRSENADYEAEHPHAALAARGAGGMVTGGAVAPFFNAARAAVLPYLGQTLSTVVGATTAGGVAGAATGAAESDDWSKPANVLRDTAVGGALGAGTGALLTGAPAAAIGGARLTGQALRAGKDIVDRVIGTGSHGWADRERTHMLTQYLRSQGLMPSRTNMGATPGDAGQHVAGLFDEANRLNPGGVYPVSYPLNTAYGRRLQGALTTSGADVSPIQTMAQDMTHGQAARTRAFVGSGQGDTFATRGRLQRAATTDMTPSYEAIGPTPVNVPHLAALSQADENVGSMLPISARAAATERRLPYADIEASSNLGAPRQLTQRQLADNALAQAQGLPPPHATHEPTQTTVGVIENMRRRAGGRIATENTTDTVTSLRAQHNIDEALLVDEAANPALGRLRDLTRRHSEAKAAEENFVRGQSLLKQSGPQRDESLISMFGEDVPNVRHAGEEGLRRSVTDAVAGTPTETVGNVGRLVGPAGQRRAMAVALSRQRGTFNDREAGRIADHILEVGQRAEHARTIQQAIQSGQVLPVSGSEIVGRAAITAGMTPGLGVARAAQLGQGMNRGRASEFIDLMAQQGNTAGARNFYEQLARDIVARQLANPYAAATARAAASVIGQEGDRHAVGR